MAVKKGLGKGIDGLIVGAPKKEKKEKQAENVTIEKDDKSITIVKISMVEPNREQPRKNFDEDALIELSDSIQKVGILSPLLVLKKEDYYEIIAGERRWRAAKLAGLKEVPVIIKNYDDQSAIEVSLIENIQREKLNPIEEALAYKRLIKEFNLKQDEVAERVSKSRTAVTNTMRLLKLDERVQNMLIDEMISMGHARALLSIEDRERQFEVASKVFDEKLSVRDIEKIIKAMKKEKPAIKDTKKEVKELDYIYKDISENMTSALGTKVSVNPKTKHAGKIEIEYYSEEELDRIMNMIMSVKE